MNELIQQMKVVLASSFAFYLKAQNFHWNVEGPLFHQYHALFGDIYNEVWGAVDQIAEQVRALDSYVPGSLGRYSQLSKIDDQINIPVASAMVKELISDNNILIAELNKAFKLVEIVDNQGLLDFIAGRLDAHAKHGWMLKASSK